MNTHTGGTWCCNEVGEICTRDNIIAEIVGYDNSGPGDTYEDAREEIEANGRLIAAAPELLVALTELVAEHDAKELPQGHYPRDTGGMELARNAIAKAEGLTPT